MVFGDVISFVVSSWCPIMAKLFLNYPVAKPMVFHIHGFEFFHDIVVDDAECSGVVRLHWCGWLGVAQEFERVPCGDGLSAIYVKGSYFGLGGG